MNLLVLADSLFILLIFLKSAFQIPRQQFDKTDSFSRALEMPRPMRPAKSAIDRMFDASGLTGESKKNMNLYPKLEQFPLPFPNENEDFKTKVDIMNKLGCPKFSRFLKLAKISCLIDIQASFRGYPLLRFRKNC